MTYRRYIHAQSTHVRTQTLCDVNEPNPKYMYYLHADGTTTLNFVLIVMFFTVQCIWPISQYKYAWWVLYFNMRDMRDRIS